MPIPLIDNINCRSAQVLDNRTAGTSSNRSSIDRLASGLLRYETNTDEWIYYKNSTDGWVTLSSNVGGINLTSDSTINISTNDQISINQAATLNLTDLRSTTQASGDNSTLVATTAFVQSTIDTLIDSAPGALDTLNELATALGNDENFSTTITNSLALKLNISDFTAHPTYGITTTDITNWNTAYGWGDHSQGGYLTNANITNVLLDGDFTTAGIMATDGSGNYSIITDNSANWNTAYGWGDHGQGGYLTSFTELDPVFTSHTVNNISDGSGLLQNDGSGNWSYDNNTYLTSASLSGYATQSYVTTQINNLINSAPAALDTLNELAAALNDDPNFATTITNSIADCVKITNVNQTVQGIKTFSGKLAGSNNAPIYGFMNPNNPEGKHIINPFFFNDMSYARLRGASISVSVTGGTNPSNSNIDAMLDSSTGFWNMATSGVTSCVITFDSLPKNLSHTTFIGATFGNTNWRPKDIIIEVYNSNGWVTELSVTNQTEEFIYVKFNNGSDTTTKIRYTFSNFNTTSMRIVSLFAYNYSAVGLPSHALTLNGGTVYGDTTLNGVSIGNTSGSITSTKVTQWDTAYSWGDHSQGGYLTSANITNVLLDGDFTTAGIMATDGSGNYSIITDNSANWNTAYGWGDHSQGGYLTSTNLTNVLLDGDFTTAGIMATDGSGNYSIITDNSANWNTAYGWGNHTSAGYLTSFSETDTLQSVTSRGSSTTVDLKFGSYTRHHTGHNNTSQFTFNAEYQGGQSNDYVPDYNGAASAGMTVIKMPSGGQAGLQVYIKKHGTTGGTHNLSTFTKTFEFKDDGTNFSTELFFGTNSVTNTRIGNWNDAYSWGDHSQAGYLTSFSETDTLATVTTRGNTTTNNISVGKITATWGEFTTTNNTDPGSDDLNVSGYGILGNRTLNPIYVHNFGNGGVRIGVNTTLGNGSNGVLITDAVSTFYTSITMNHLQTSTTFSGNTSGNLTINNTTGTISFRANGSTVNSMTITSSLITLNENVQVNGTIDMGTNIITDTKVGQWDTAYNWGDHASAGYREDNGVEIADNYDLNNLINTGLYAQNSNSQASNGTNYPIAKAGILEVIRDPGNGYHTQQTYYTYNHSGGDNLIYVRYRYDTSNSTGGWSNWERLIKSGDSINATTLDSQPGTNYLRSDIDDTHNGVLNCTKVTTGTAAVHTVGGAHTLITDSFSMMSSTSDLCYFRPSQLRSDNGHFQLQTYNGGNGGELEIQPYGGSMCVSTGSITSADTGRGLMFQTGSGNYSDGRWRHRFRKRDMGGGIPLFIDISQSTANSYTHIARFGAYTGNTHEFEVFGDINATGTLYDSGNAVLTTATSFSNSGGDATVSGSYNSLSITNITAANMYYEDNRIISPSELSARHMKFGFTSFANNNTAPWADFLHLRSYGDASGGSDNLVVFKKSGIGMRIYQQGWGSTTAYSTYKDVVLKDSNGQIVFDQNTTLVFPDITSIPDNPTNQQFDYMRFGANGSISQVSGRGALMITSSDDSLVLANGDVGRNFTNSNIDVDPETIFMLSDGIVHFKTNLQAGYSGAYHNYTFDGGSITRSTNGVSNSTVTFLHSGDSLDASSLQGVSLDKFVYGTQINGSTTAPVTHSSSHITQWRSGFFDVNGASWMPSTGWWWCINTAHTSNSSSYNYSGQIAIQNSSDPEMHFRTIHGNGTQGNWRRILDTVKDSDILRTGSSLNSANLTGTIDIARLPSLAGSNLFHGSTIGTNTDWNTFINGSEFHINPVVSPAGAAFTANGPSTYAYGLALSFAQSGQGKIQIYGPHNGSEQYGLHYRTGWNTDYDAWARLLDTTNDSDILRTNSNLNASNLTTGTIPDARLSSGVFRHRGSLSITTTNPFLDTHTQTKIAEFGSRSISYTGASASLLTWAVGGSASVVQIGAHYNGDDYYLRTRTDSTNWKTWKKIWHDGNFDPNNITVNETDTLATVTGRGASTSTECTFSGSYYEFGNGTGSVSNDGTWNGRLNVAGTSHARLDVKSVSDGIISTIYAHTGHNEGRFGTISNHRLALMNNGTSRAYLETDGTFHVPFGNLLVGADGQTPKLNLIYTDSANGAAWDTMIHIGRTDDVPNGTGFPTSVAAGGYGMQIQANSDGVFFGLDQYTSGNYRPFISWGDDTTDSPFSIRFNNAVKFEFSHDGIFTPGSIHCGSTASLTDGTDPNISTILLYATTKVVTPKLVFLNDAAGDDNYITCNDDNNAHPIHSHTFGAYFNFFGDKIAHTATNSACLVASGVKSKYIQGEERVYIGTGGGYFYNDSGSRVRINQDFYTNNSNTYLYGDNTYLGSTSGDNIYVRGNPISGNNWDIQTNGVASFVDVIASGTVSGSSFSCDSKKFMDMPSSSNDRGPFNPIAVSLRHCGRNLYDDEEFRFGSNGIGVYNNSGGTGVVITRIAFSDKAPNSTNYVLQIANNGNATSPGYGGFIHSIPSEENHTFVQIFQAKLEQGRNLIIAENAQGTRNTSYWLTDTSGTGKWEWYIRISHCGDSGSFSSGGHVYVSGGTAVFTWYLASCTVVDVTEANWGHKYIHGNLILDGDSTTTNQGRMIDFTGFDKESTSDRSDRAYIQHTTGVQHSGSVLLISSQNDATDGIAFATNGSSNLLHNGNIILTSGNFTSTLNGTYYTETECNNLFHTKGYPVFSGDSVSKSDISTRTESGFYEYSLTGTGYPSGVGTSWRHTISCTHSNDSNYYAMQITGSFYDNTFYGRKTQGNGNAGWVMFHTTDTIDTTLYAKRASRTNATCSAGWVSVAENTSGRKCGDILVTDGESGDHSYIRMCWTRSYQHSQVSVLNCSGHGSRITGFRVIQDSDTTYGRKVLQVYVTTSSNYYVHLYDNMPAASNFTLHTLMTPVTQNLISGYNVIDVEVTNMESGTGLSTSDYIQFGRGLRKADGTEIISSTGNITNVTGVIRTSGTNNFGYGTIDFYTCGLNLTGSASLNLQANSTNIRFYDNALLYFGTDFDARMFHDNANLYLRLNNDDSFYIQDQNSSNANRFRFESSNGNFTATGNVTAYGSASDINKKENISRLTNAEEIIDSINGYKFNYIGHSDKLIGVIAQEVEKVAPELVYEYTELETDKTYKAMRYENLTAVLLEGIKSQKEEIKELKSQVKQLQNTVKLLVEKINIM